MITQYSNTNLAYFIRQAITFALIGLLAQENYMILAYYGISLPLFGVAFTISLGIKIMNISDEQKFTLMDMIQCIKLGLMAYAIIGGLTDTIIVSFICLFENFDAMIISNGEQELGIVPNLVMTLIFFALFTIFTLIACEIFYNNLWITPETALWGSVLLCVFCISSMFGCSVNDVLFPYYKENKPSSEKSKDMTSSLQWFTCMLIAFLISAPSLTIVPWYMGQLPSLAFFTDYYFFRHCISSLILYSIQPLVEEILFRSFALKLLEKYGFFHPENDDIYEKVLVSLLLGWLFTVAHIFPQGTITVDSLMLRLIMGTGMCLQTILTGDIVTSTFFHACHNFCCDTQSYFCWFFRGCPQFIYNQHHISPLLAETVRGLAAYNYSWIRDTLFSQNDDPDNIGNATYAAV